MVAVDLARNSLCVVLGPARSGKSCWAEHLAASSGFEVTYLATGSHNPDDFDWQERLKLHRNRRPAAWGCLEVGFELVESLEAFAPGQLALIDSLGSWVVWGLSLDTHSWEVECTALLSSIRDCRGRIIIVSEQTGWGVVPATAIGGLFRDRLGALEQQLLQIADQAWLVVAGRALNLFENSVAVPSC